MPRKEIEDILSERQNIYGDAHKNFAITGRIWGAMLQTDDIPAWQYKSVRCFANPAHEDSWQDKLGYTIHGREIAMTDEP